MEINIDQRTGLPEELHVLLKDHPRDTWPNTRSPLARFWIDKHNYLRRQSEALQATSNEYRENPASPAQFGATIAPQLQRFLAELHGHHQIEDHHYFPAFRAADARLAAGFDVLARDHELLHEGIVDIVETVNQFLAAIEGGTSDDVSALKHAADQYIDAGRLMHSRLERHLADEEDLIIPLMISRGE